jgi:hypothetical protein
VATLLEPVLGVAILLEVLLGVANSGVVVGRFNLFLVNVDVAKGVASIDLLGFRADLTFGATVLADDNVGFRILPKTVKQA